MRTLLLMTLALGACRGGELPVTDIVAVNYAYQVPHTLPPGRRLFRLVNQGAALHEVQLYRLHPGISPDSARRLLAGDGIPASLTDGLGGSVLIAAPGQTTPELLYADLRPGEVYALECAFRDSASAPPHNQMGMIGAFEVSAR